MVYKEAQIILESFDEEVLHWSERNKENEKSSRADRKYSYLCVE